MVPAGGESAGEPAGTAPTEPGLAGASTTHLVVPDVIASVPGGLTQADLGRLKKLGGVRAVLAIDGARITVNGVRAHRARRTRRRAAPVDPADDSV